MKLHEEFVKEKDKKLKVIEFDNFYDVETYINNNHPEKHKHLLKQIEDEPDFHDCKGGLPQAMEELRYGRKEITAKYLDELVKVNNYGEIKTQQFKMSEDGTTYDIGAVIEGVPECCIEDALLPTLKKRIKIYIDLAYNWATDRSCINNRGVALYNFINTLIRNNYIVEVYTVDYSDHKQNKVKQPYDTLSIIKIASLNNQPLLPHLAYAGATSYFRVISWFIDAMVHEDYTGANTWDYCGGNIPDELKEKWKQEGIFYVPGYYGDNDAGRTDTMEKAEKFIQKHWKKFNEKKGDK